MQPINSSFVKSSTNVSSIEKNSNTEVKCENCLPTAKKIVELAAASPTPQPPKPETDDIDSSSVRRANTTQEENEKWAKEFFDEYFEKMRSTNVTPDFGISSKTEASAQVMNSILEILCQSLEKSSNQALLAEYAYWLYKTKRFEEFDRILKKLEDLGNVCDVLILKILATSNIIDPNVEEKIKAMQTATKSLMRRSNQPLKKYSSDAKVAKEIEKTVGNEEEILKLDQLMLAQQELAILKAKELVLTYTLLTPKNHILKRGFDDLIILLCDKYGEYDQASFLISDFKKLDLEEETKKRLYIIRDTIFLYFFLINIQKAPLLTLNKKFEVVFNVISRNNNDKDKELLLENRFLLRKNIYNYMLMAIVSIWANPHAKIDLPRSFNIPASNKDSTSLLLQFYFQLSEGTLKEVPPKPQVSDKGYNAIESSEENILEYSFKHEYLYARALSILSFKGNNKIYLMEALDHLNVIIADKQKINQYIDEAYYKIRGRILFQLKQYSEALEDFLLIYKNDPNDPKKVLEAATVLAKLGHKECLAFILTFFEGLPSEAEGTKGLAPILKVAFANIQAMTTNMSTAKELFFNRIKAMLQKTFKDKAVLCQQYYELAQMVQKVNPSVSNAFFLHVLEIDPNFKPAQIALKKSELESQSAETKTKLTEEEKPEVNTVTRTKKIAKNDERPPSSSPSPKVNPEAEHRRRAVEEQTRLEEEREKARYAKLQREHQQKVKEEKRIATGRAQQIPVQTQPVSLIAAQNTPAEWLPELKVNRKFNVDYLVNEVMPNMIRCTYAELTEEEKKAEIKNVESKKVNPQITSSLLPPKLLDDRKPEEATAYRKEIVDKDAPLTTKKKKTKDPFVIQDNPDINRVESARRHIRDLEDLFKSIERNFPQSVPLNVYAVDRALKYYLMRFGECLHSTSEQSRLSEATAKEISSKIINIEIAHQLRNDVRNWFPCIKSDELLSICQILIKYQLHDSFKSWVISKDNSNDFKSCQKVFFAYRGLVPFEEKEKWRHLNDTELRQKYINLLMNELDAVSLIKKSDKLTLTSFKSEGKTYQSAVKMSISIISKCLTKLEIDPKVFKSLTHLANLIGHEIGENEQIRYYEFEEVKDANILYNLSLNAQDLKAALLKMLKV